MPNTRAFAERLRSRPDHGFIERVTFEEEYVTLTPVLWASLFLGAGLLTVLFLSFNRQKPKALEAWLFITLVLLFVGGVSLGITGSAVAFVFTPLLNLLGFPSTDLRTSWLGAMALSFLCPPGLALSQALARLRRKQYWLVFLLSFFLYCLLASVVVYFIVEWV